MGIIAVEQSERTYLIGERDCHETCVTDAHIEFFDEDDYFVKNDVEPIGVLEGTLVNVAAMNDDPCMVCDDIAQDLGYIMQQASGLVKVCLFYICRFDMDDKEKAAKIIRDLPGVVFKLMGRRPDLLVSYPDSLPYEIDEETRQHQQNLILHHSHLINKMFNSSGFGNADSTKDDELPYGPDYKFTKEDIDFLMGSGGGYPEEAIDKEAFDFWKSLGFTEKDNSRVLMYTVRSRR